MWQPLILPANQPERHYRGGELIAEFRGEPRHSGTVPEDWIASTTTLADEAELGLTVLPDGRRLVDAIAADPVAWLGSAHVEAFGADTKLLVKLLHPGQRLPVHAHPASEFANEWLGRAHGKAEAWHILAGGDVYVGLNRAVELDEVLEIVRAQDIERLLALLHRRTVSPGQTVYVPPGTLHAIGPGILLAEIQEPEDLSILLDWHGFETDLEPVGHLGLGYDVALQGVDLTGSTDDEIDALISGPDDAELLPPGADEYFRAARLGAGAELAPGFAVLIVVSGTVDLVSVDAAPADLAGAAPVSPAGTAPAHLAGARSAPASLAGLPAGTTLVLPHAAGAFVVGGEGDVLVYRPPAP